MGKDRKGVTPLAIVCTRIAYTLRVPATGEAHVMQISWLLGKYREKQYENKENYRF